jgi:hypothetical protein
MNANPLPPGGGSFIRDSEDGEWRPNIPQSDPIEGQPDPAPAPTQPAAAKEPRK